MNIVLETVDVSSVPDSMLLNSMMVGLNFLENQISFGKKSNPLTVLPIDL